MKDEPTDKQPALCNIRPGSSRICERGTGSCITIHAAAPAQPVPAQKWSVIDYCVEEVKRQGHDVTALDGLERVGWMLNAWAYALTLPWERPSLTNIEILGSLVERLRNHGFRSVGVRVGYRICPPANEVRDRLQRLIALWPMEPIQFYKEFELVHPFVDGNGRTGKILLNGLSGTLLTPYFPPNNLFGEEIRNP